MIGKDVNPFYRNCIICMPVLGMMMFAWMTGLLSCLCGGSALLLGIRLKKVLK